MFAHRYWELSIKVEEVKFGKNDMLSPYSNFINITVWLLILFQGITQQLIYPSALPHLSLWIALFILLCIIGCLFGAMARIWRLGTQFNELLPNMLMIKVLVGVYILFFFG